MDRKYLIYIYREIIGRSEVRFSAPDMSGICDFLGHSTLMSYGNMNSMKDDRLVVI